MKRFVPILLALVLLAACGTRGQAAAPEKEGGPSSVSGPASPSSVQPEPEGSEYPPQDADLYRYNTIPDFSIPNIIPQKITYESVLLGETTTIVDAERIGQVMELVGKVEISNKPFREEPDAELHHVIGFYQDPADEEPAYSLCFFADSVYLAAKGDRSDAYPTPNWDNAGLHDDDSPLINIQLRNLIGSWNRLDFLPLPEDASEEQSNHQRANALFSDLNTLFSLSKESYSYFTCYSGGGPVTLEIGVTDEAAVDDYLAAWTGTKWDRLLKVPGRVSQARQEEFAQAAGKLDLGPDVSFYVTARNGPSLTETGRIFISVTVTSTEPWEDIPQAIKDLAGEMDIPEDMLFFLCNITSGDAIANSVS